MKNLSFINVRVLLFFFIAEVFYSCNPVYFPNSINSPMLRNKKEIQANMMVGTGGFELQSAYAVTDDLGLMLNGSYIASTKNDTIKEVRSLGELGLGYSKRFGEMGQFEIFGGAGLGKVPADFRGTNYDGTQKANLTRFFIQPAIGLSSKIVDFSFASRFVAVNAGGETNTFIEPGFIVKLGYKNVKLVGTLGVSIPTKDATERKWDHNPFMIGIGLHLNFNRKYKE